VYIVPDEAKVVRVSEVVKMVVEDNKSQRQVAQELGVSTATVTRAIEDAGYEIQRTVTIVKKA
jgi:Trp operon repressor